MFRFLLLALVSIGAIAAVLIGRGDRGAISLSVEPRELPADGYSEAVATIHSSAFPKISTTSRGARIGKPRQTAEHTWRAVIRAGTVPGEATLTVDSAEGQAQTDIVFQRFDADRSGNGMPDALELDSERDQQAFRKWFTFLAEAQYFQKEASRPREIDDCAALIRYAYREALKAHDAGWAREAGLPLIRAIPQVEKYQYPNTLLGASLFRIKSGVFEARDGGAFSQFADAQTLQRFNTRLVTRDISRAQPGDLLFYRHDEADLPFHGMIYLGPSQIENADGERYLVYHTGPDRGDPGEIRRPTVSELLRHPNPAWRPLAGNPAFLGVYRWNILP